MYKLFGSLFLIITMAILATAGILSIALDDNDLKSTNYQGMFYLLDKQIKKTENKTLDLHQIQQWFAYKIDLKPLDTFAFSDVEFKTIIRGEPVMVEIDGGDFIYKLSTSKTGYVWVAQIGLMDSDEDHQDAIGTALLIEDYLRPYQPEQWPKKLAELEREFEIPLALISLQQALTHVSSFNGARLQVNKAVSNDNTSSFDSMYYYRLLQSDKVVVVGPMPMGWFEKIIAWTQNALLTIFLLFSLILLVALSFWLWPLWRSLLSLRYAVDQFGKGNFDVRVHTSPLSMIQKISGSFNSMATRIQALIASHKELTNAVSHELRTPLARMQFSLQALMDARDNEEKECCYQEVLIDIKELDSLINEMLVYARFERVQPTIEFSSILLIPWVQQEYKRVQMNHLNQNYQLDITGLSVSEQAQFEPRLLTRALSNLLRNANRYTETTIRLTITSDQNHYLFIVEDDGLGIPDEHREIIFKPFQRIDTSRDRNTGGHGLGLAIVQQIARWHRGDCYVDSSPLGGAKFVFSICKHKSLNGVQNTNCTHTE